MRTHLYTNHHMHERRPKRPVLAVQRGKRVRYTNEVRLTVDGRYIGRLVYRKSGLRSAPYHRVRAWIELEPTVEVKCSRK